MLMTASLASQGINDGLNTSPQRFHNRALLPMVIIFLGFSYSSIILRLWTRKHFLKRLGWDDYMIIVAAAFFSVYCSTILAMFCLASSARGFRDIPPHHIGVVASLLVVTECFYLLAMIALKLSLAIFFLRILNIPWQRWIIVTTTSLATVFGIVNLFFAIFQCGYFSHITIFVGRIVKNQCASEALGLGINYTYASLATISDWTCVLVPIFVLKESTMPTRRKLVVGGLMIFASLGSVASIVRMHYLHTITVPTGEFFVNVSKLSIWSTIEPGVGITVASLATLRPLFSRLVERTRRPNAATHTSPCEAYSDSNTCTLGTSIQTYKGGGSVGTSSDSTVVAPSSFRPIDGVCSKCSKCDERRSKEEKLEDIEAEMRAYGMSDLSKSPRLDEQDFGLYTPEMRRTRETERRMRWFQSQRAVRHPVQRESREYMLRTASPSRPSSRNLSSRRQRLHDSVEEWKDSTLNELEGSFNRSLSTPHQ